MTFYLSGLGGSRSESKEHFIPVKAFRLFFIVPLFLKKVTQKNANSFSKNNININY